MVGFAAVFEEGSLSLEGGFVLDGGFDEKVVSFGELCALLKVGPLLLVSAGEDSGAFLVAAVEVFGVDGFEVVEPVASFLD